MEQILITEASLINMRDVQRIARETFAETFSEANTVENMTRYLQENFSDEKIKTELSNPDTQFFIAWEGEAAIGYLKVNSGQAQTELQDPGSLEIERIYVKSNYHGKKVGQMLYGKAVETARSLKKSFIWLGVWEENLKAIRFYEKNGFIAFDKHVFVFGEDRQTDIMMKKVLAL